MIERKTGLAVLAAAVLLLGVGIFLADGGGRAGPDNQSSGDSLNASVTESGDASFNFTVTRVEECGRTCRDVTAILQNTGDETADNVVVNVSIYTEGDRVWTNEFRVGGMEEGGSVTSTQRVDLGFGEALQIQGNDGWITIRTVVRSDAGTSAFTERQKVV